MIVAPFKTQLLKWVGNKQRMAHDIISYFPEFSGIYREPFVGSAAVLATLAPNKGVASDCLRPLIDLWIEMTHRPENVKNWYTERYEKSRIDGKLITFDRIKLSFNQNQNAADLLFISRACYGGVIRFRKKDGFISTPCGVHDLISPKSFNDRVDIWAKRLTGTRFSCMDYKDAMRQSECGDIIYCDPPILILNQFCMVLKSLISTNCSRKFKSANVVGLLLC